jgi:hypothetical protein
MDKNNIQFNYLYRDGGNYKNTASIVFSNPENLRLFEIKKRLEEAFFQQELFIADQVGIPEVFLFYEFELNEDDHCFHEFSGCEVTNAKPNDKLSRSISDFIDEVENQSAEGWLAFIPSES